MLKIFHLLSPGVITGKKVQKIFNYAKKTKFAIPAINCIGLDSINAALEAAAKYHCIIIIQFSKTSSQFMAGKYLSYTKKNAILGAISGALHVHNVAKYYKVPVILHTDHCTQKDLFWLNGLLKEDKKYKNEVGKTLFSSHMVDFSQETLNKNIKLSTKYLKKTSRLHMTLEIELGCTGGEEDRINNSKLNQKKLYTSPKDVLYAYQKLNKISSQFIIAAAFGNIHGVYKINNIKLKPQILNKIQKKISNKYNLPKNPICFVFHGGSGSSIKKIQKSINYGVVKINIDTDIQWATWKGILIFYKKNKKFLHQQIGCKEQNYQPNKKYYNPRVWIRNSQKYIIKTLINIFHYCNILV